MRSQCQRPRPVSCQSHVARKVKPSSDSCQLGNFLESISRHQPRCSILALNQSNDFWSTSFCFISLEISEMRFLPSKMASQTPSSKTSSMPGTPSEIPLTTGGSGFASEVLERFSGSIEIACTMSATVENEPGPMWKLGLDGLPHRERGVFLIRRFLSRQG